MTGNAKPLKILIYGASGMLGQAVLRECDLDLGVAHVLAMGRSPIKTSSSKVRQITTANLSDLEPFREDLRDLDACFFTLGASAAGLSEEAYSKINYDLPVEIAKQLRALNPAMSFIYVSGAGTDSSGKGRVMWARVKGRTENALLQIPFKASYMFRPGLIIPMHGESSRTPMYRYIYNVLRPFNAWLARLPGKYAITTEDIARAMLVAARKGSGPRVLESAEIKILANS